MGAVNGGELGHIGYNTDLIVTELAALASVYFCPASEFQGSPKPSTQSQSLHLSSVLTQVNKTY